MKKSFLLTAFAAVLLCSCGNQNGKAEISSEDSTAVESSTSATPIEGYESSEEFGIKAWIEDGVAKWKLADQSAWLKFNDNPDFVRVEENDPYTVEMREAAVGVKILRHGSESDNNAVLAIISQSGHVYTLQLNEALACVTLDAGKLPYGDNVTGIKSEKKGNVYVISTEQSDGGSVDVSLYSYDTCKQGPRDFVVLVGEGEYMVSMQSSWACTLRDDEGKTYVGTFVAVGDEAPNTWQLTFNETAEYTEDGNHYNAIDPISVTIEWNGANETVKFSKNTLGIPENKFTSVEVLPLYD